jgi:hypothetical protein
MVIASSISVIESKVKSMLLYDVVEPPPPGFAWQNKWITQLNTLRTDVQRALQFSSNDPVYAQLRQREILDENEHTSLMAVQDPPTRAATFYTAIESRSAETIKKFIVFTERISTASSFSVRIREAVQRNRDFVLQQYRQQRRNWLLIISLCLTEYILKNISIL